MGIYISVVYFYINNIYFHLFLSLENKQRSSNVHWNLN